MVSLGISPEYFLYKMSIDAGIAVLKAKTEKERDAWERTRQQCFYSVLPYSKIKSPDQLFTLPWDNKEKKTVKKLTKEQHKKKMKQAEKYLPKIKSDG